MSRISELLTRARAVGVTYRPLGELLDYEQPTPYLVSSKNYDDSFTTPVLTPGQTFVLGYTDETRGIYPASPDSPVILFDDFTTARRWVDFPFKVKSSAVKLLTAREGVLFRYLWYVMQTIRYAPTDHARQWISTFSSFRVPVPPLEVQQEIVRILDTFTELEAELETERLLRREQRRTVIGNQFLSLTETTRVCLGDLVRQFVDPVVVQADREYVNLGVKWFGEGVFAREPRLGSDIKASTLYRVREGQFVYNRMFVTEGSFGIVPAELAHGVVSNEFPVFELDVSRILPEWLLLKFRDPYVVAQAARQASGGTKSRRRWREDQFRAFEIDLPPLEVQAEMVRVHRHFMELESRLEAELDARRQQYAYYRDRLLSFEEAA